MKAFEDIYKEYYSSIYGFMLKLTSGDVYMAEEITQECFYQTFISFHKFKGKSTFFVWLCGIAKNCYYKKLKREKEIFMDISVLSDIVMDSHDMEKAYENKEMLLSIRDFVMKLNRQQRDIVILRSYFEMNYSDIGKLLKISEESARVSFYRAKKKMEHLF